MNNSDDEFYNNLNIFTIKSQEEYIKNKENIDINLWNPDLQNAVVHALENEDYDKVNWLLDEDIVLKENEHYIEDIQNNNHITSHCLRLTIEKPELQKKMIEKGLKIEPFSDFYEDERSILEYSASIEVLNILLKAGHLPHFEKDVVIVKDGFYRKENFVFNILTEITPNIVFWDYLLKNNISNINETDPRGNTILFNCEDEKEIIYLIDKKIDINHRNNKGDTALLGASFEKTKMLLEAGADVNIKSESGENALLRTNDINTALLLIEKGISTEGDVYLWSKINREWVKDKEPVSFMSVLEKNNKIIFNIVNAIKEKEYINSNFNNEEKSIINNIKKRI